LGHVIDAAGAAACHCVQVLALLKALLQVCYEALIQQLGVKPSEVLCSRHTQHICSDTPDVSAQLLW
jgi:hypothetical protein